MELSDGLRAVLESQGFRVFQARDGQQGKTARIQEKLDHYDGTVHDRLVAAAFVGGDHVSACLCLVAEMLQHG